MARRTDGVFLSNGPGDPAPVILSEAIGRVEGPIKNNLHAIRCTLYALQLLALALGARTYKLKFGHHGANHPALVLDWVAASSTLRCLGMARSA